MDIASVLRSNALPQSAMSIVVRVSTSKKEESTSSTQRDWTDLSLSTWRTI